MTGALWRSAFVASLFALHPINVESVAWVAERKNVLSTFLWMTTMLAYAIYSERPCFTRYLTVLFVFALGLLAKPMLVTLPFVLLLLDYWPLKRLRMGLVTARPAIKTQQTAKFFNYRLLDFRPVLEKLPLLALSLVAAYLSSASLQLSGSIKALDDVPMLLRLANALVSYVKYIGKMIWPHNLTVFYPYPESVPLWQTLGASILLICITVLVVWSFRRQPYLGVGWLWYLGTLIPVSGLMQAGLWPEMADRWAYLPFIGLFIMIAWGVPDLAKRWVYPRAGLGIITSVVLAALMALTWTQIRYWKNSVRLFEHALAVNQTNWLAHNNLGTALAAQGKNFEAHQHFFESLKIDPGQYNPHNNLGAFLASKNRSTEAIKYFSEALRLNPNSAHAHVNMGTELLKLGKIEPAIGHLKKALNLKPGFPESHNILGLALLRKGKLEAAIGHFRMAFKVKPNYADAQQNLNLALSNNEKLNRAAKNMLASMNFHPDDPDLDFKIKDLLEKKKALEQAISYFQKSLSLQPGFNKKDYIDVGIVSETKKSYDKMLRQFQQIMDQRPDIAEVYYHIACIYSRQGKIHASIQLLDLAIQKGFARWDLINTDSDLDTIRNLIDEKWLVKS
jgi:tetratricopeptide (TPR) repeat protein